MTTTRYLRALLRYWRTCLRWALQTAGYWVRPYDMLADARRWRWQEAQRCTPIVIRDPQVVAELEAKLRAMNPGKWW